jgi:hypothetical protein
MCAWFDPSLVSEELALYDALSQVERWATVHLGSPRFASE